MALSQKQRRILFNLVSEHLLANQVQHVPMDDKFIYRLLPALSTAQMHRDEQELYQLWERVRAALSDQSFKALWSALPEFLRICHLAQRQSSNFAGQAPTCHLIDQLTVLGSELLTLREELCSERNAHSNSWCTPRQPEDIYASDLLHSRPEQAKVFRERYTELLKPLLPLASESSHFVDEFVLESMFVSLHYAELPMEQRYPTGSEPHPLFRLSQNLLGARNLLFAEVKAALEAYNSSLNLGWQW